MKLYVVIISMLIVSIPFTMFAQEKEKKIRIKTVKVIDGEKVVTDTTITIDGDEDFEKTMTEFNIETDDSDEVSVNVFVETDIDEESGEKTIIIKTGEGEDVKVVQGHGGTYSYTIDTDVDIDKDCDGEKKIIVVSPHSGNKKVMMWKSDDGEEYVFDMDEEYKITMKELEGELEAIKEITIELEDLEDMEHMILLHP